MLAAEDQVSLDALERVKEALSGYDLYVTGDTGSSDSASLDAEMQVVMVVIVRENFYFDVAGLL